MSSKLVDDTPEPADFATSRPAGNGVKPAFAIVAPVAAALAALAVHFVQPNRPGVTRWWDELQGWQHPYPVLLEILFAFAILLAGLHLIVPSCRAWVRYHAPLLAGAIAVLGAWDLLTQNLGRTLVPFFPTPDLVFGGMAEDWQILLRSTQQSLVLLLSGYGCGIALGISTGILVGWFPGIRYWVMPAMKFVGPIPATALIALVMILSSHAFLCGVLLIAFVVWFPVTMLTSSGIASVRLSHLDVARTLGAGPFFLIFRVALPSALPNIFIGLFMGLLASFLTLVVAETVGVEAGLGHYFKLAQGDIRYDKMYGALVIMALFCSGLMTVLFKVRDWMLQWQQGVIKW